MPDPKLRILLEIASVNILQPSTKKNWDLSNGTFQGNRGFYSHGKLSFAPQVSRGWTGDPLDFCHLILRQKFAKQVFMSLDTFEGMQFENKFEPALFGQST